MNAQTENIIKDVSCGYLMIDSEIHQLDIIIFFPL